MTFELKYVLLKYIYAKPTIKKKLDFKIILFFIANISSEILVILTGNNTLILF